MKTLLAIAALTLATAAPALAFDAGTDDVIARHKAGKPLAITDVAQLMASSERWCYAEDAGTCAWSDIYLEVTDTGATYEIGNAWDETTDIAFTDYGVFKDDRYVCESGIDWVPTLRAISRETGAMLGGRELFAIKAEITASHSEATIDCFDYVYRGADAQGQTVTLLQRQYTDDAYRPDLDTEVTLHFAADDAAALTWRW